MDSDGTLTYRPADDAHGTATIGIRVLDNGGTANGGDDNSPSQSFTVTVDSVNDVPSFTETAVPGEANPTSAEDAPLQTVFGWATNISAGAANESSQTLTFVITGNDNPPCSRPQPSINAAGDLSFKPAANKNGTANLTVHLEDDGGTAQRRRRHQRRPVVLDHGQRRQRSADRRATTSFTVRLGGATASTSRPTTTAAPATPATRSRSRP